MSVYIRDNEREKNYKLMLVKFFFLFTRMENLVLFHKTKIRHD
jgi:hypothetical protein